MEPALAPALALSLAFVVLLLAQLLLRTWLLARQMRHVARWRHRVLLEPAGHVSLEAHQRAADYTLARVRSSLWEALLAWLGPGLAQLLALVAAFFVLGTLLELPLAWWRTFRLEQRFGFNRTTLGLWLADGAKGALVAAALGLQLVALPLTLMERAGPW